MNSPHDYIVDVRDFVEPLAKSVLERSVASEMIPQLTFIGRVS